MCKNNTRSGSYNSGCGPQRRLGHPGHPSVEKANKEKPDEKKPDEEKPGEQKGLSYQEFTAQNLPKTQGTPAERMKKVATLWHEYKERTK